MVGTHANAEPVSGHRRGRKANVANTQEGEEDEFAGFTDDEPDQHESDVDSTEEELERLVFGDTDGFKRAVKKQRDLTKLARTAAEETIEQDGGTGLEGVADDDLFFIDSGPMPASGALIAATGDESSDSDDDSSRDGRVAPAWDDSDDDRIAISIGTVPRLRNLRRYEGEDAISGRQYIRRLRQQFERLHPRPEWVRYAMQHASKREKTENGADESDSSPAEDMDFDGDDLAAQPLAKLLQSAQSLTTSAGYGRGERRRFRPEIVEIQHTSKIMSPARAPIESLQVHPTLPFLLASSANSTAYIYRLTPEQLDPNPLLTSIHIKRNPFTTSAFHPSPTDPRVFLSARRRFFHVWNLATGHIEKVSRVYGHRPEQKSMERFKLSPDGAYLALQGTAEKDGGTLNLLDAHTLQWTAQARIESLKGIADFAWWSDSAGLSIAGCNGEVTEWSLAARRAVARWRDEGAVGTTALALGGSGGPAALGRHSWVAVGSSAGIVNIYDRRGWSGQDVPPNPTPRKALDNILHPISHLAFAPDGQLLCMASRFSARALRLVHLPSCTVYKNWPTPATGTGRVSAMAWGRREDGQLLLVLGAESGKITGFEVRGR